MSRRNYVQRGASLKNAAIAIFIVSLVLLVVWGGLIAHNNSLMKQVEVAQTVQKAEYDEVVRFKAEVEKKAKEVADENARLIALKDQLDSQQANLQLRENELMQSQSDFDAEVADFELEQETFYTERAEFETLRKAMFEYFFGDEDVNPRFEVEDIDLDEEVDLDEDEPPVDWSEELAEELPEGTTRYVDGDLLIEETIEP